LVLKIGRNFVTNLGQSSPKQNALQALVEKHLFSQQKLERFDVREEPIQKISIGG